MGSDLNPSFVEAHCSFVLQPDFDPEPNSGPRSPLQTRFAVQGSSLPEARDPDCRKRSMALAVTFGRSNYARGTARL
jgi:hypothetical protein